MRSKIVLLFLVLCFQSEFMFSQIELLESNTQLIVGRETPLKLKDISGSINSVSQILIEGIEIDMQTFRCSLIQPEKYRCLIKLPSLNHLIGDDKLLTFKWKNGKVESLEVQIRGDIPNLISCKVNGGNNWILNEKNYQEITFKFNDVSFIDKIEFVDKTIKILGTSVNHIDQKSQPYFSINGDEVTLKIIPGANKDLKVILHYKDMNLNPTKTEEISLGIEQVLLAKKNKFLVFSPSGQIYLDDFDDYKTFPMLKLNFGNLDLNNTRVGYVIKDSDDFKIETLIGGREFDLSNANKEIDVELKYVKQKGTIKFEVSKKSKPKEVQFYSYCSIFPKPNIERIVIYGHNNDNVLYKDKNKDYTIEIEGEDLHLMEDLEVELSNPVNPHIVKTTPKNKNIKNKISVIVSGANLELGNYIIQLKRIGANGKTYYYPYNEKLILVEYPLIQEKLPKISIEGKTGVKRVVEGDLPLNENDEIYLKLEPNLANDYPQYLDIEATYKTYSGKKKTVKIGNDNYSVFRENLYLNLKEELSISEFKPYERIHVKVSHSRNKYSDFKPIDKPKEIKAYREMNHLERLGFTLSVPPFFMVLRNVRRKENKEFTGKKKFDYQPLVFNAGVGFKYQFLKKNSNNKDRLALGLYLLGTDFANPESDRENLEDEDNHYFVKRGSLNAFLLGEFVLFSLDEDENTRVPIYIGGAYIHDPLDKGSNFALAFGLGIDIKLKL